MTGRVYLTAEASHYLEDYTASQARSEGGGLFSFSGSGKESASKVMHGDYSSSVKGNAFPVGTSEPVKSRMAIEVVRNVDVEPKFKSLYIGTQLQTYKLRILDGSGSFSVNVNNTKIADFVQKDREIFITPKDIGSLRIMVEDLELPQAKIATAELLISDVAKLTLWAPLTLIEKGDEMDLTVSAYDAYKREFDPDQYALMNFNIETEMMGLRLTGGFQTTQVQGENRRFVALGREPGIY